MPIKSLPFLVYNVNIIKTYERNNMKKIFGFLLSGFILLSAPAFARSYLGTNIPLTGSTLLPVNQQAVVLGYVYSKASSSVRGCRALMLADTKVTEEKKNIVYDRRGKEIGGTWTEEWTVNACGTSVVVPIIFTTKRNGADYSIQQPVIK